MVKMIGGVLVVFGPYIWGCMESFRLRERIKRLEQLSQTLLLFSTQIDYAVMSIPECFEKIGHTILNDRIGAFYKNMACKLRENDCPTFNEMWKWGVDHYLSGDFLNQQDVELISQVGEIPLYLNKQIQLTMIGNIRLQLQQRADQLKKECNNKCRIYQISGLAAGIMCLLLLI